MVAVSLDDAKRALQGLLEGGESPRPQARVRVRVRPVMALLRQVQLGYRGSALVACATVLTSGAVAAHATMDVTWVQAFYFAVTTVTTVGYGDINPADKRVRMHRGQSVQDVFMFLHMIYIIVGVGTVGAAMALLVGSHLHTPWSAKPLWRTVLQSTVGFVSLTLIGAGGMCAIEDWSTLQAAYWAIVTLSTVGYGHLVPATEGGRLFASFFMICGLSCEAALFTSVAMLPIQRVRKRLESQVAAQYGRLTKEELREAAEADRYVEQVRQLLAPSVEGFARGWRGEVEELRQSELRLELCLAMLVRMGKISPQDLRRCSKLAAKLSLHAEGAYGNEEGFGMD